MKNTNIKIHLHTFSDVKYLLKSMNNFDVVIIDIKLSNDGILKVVQHIRNLNKNCKICIFVETEEYTYHLFHNHIFDCIKKPISENKIEYLFKELFKYIDFDMINKSICINTIEGFISIKYNQIIYFEYLEKSIIYPNRVVVLNTINHKYAIKTNINKLYKKLDKEIFFIPHQSFIINLDKIQFVKRNEIILVNGISIPLSQKRAVEFHNKLYEII
ncbi:LytR/AlgR family response regulator transcription factor [Thomasclavelia sp.]